MSNRYFDLNIEQVLENWEIYHAIREIIANALDETVLANCRNVDIYKDTDGFWHIRDYGRGINYHHFSQNENMEKLNAHGIIGKFGVGLKDALAVFFRHNIPVHIRSKYGLYQTEMQKKEGFNDIETLHISVSDSDLPDFVGTEFILSVSDNDMLKAKSLFLSFRSDSPLDSTEYGDIYKRGTSSAIIYVNGIQVAEEENYMFDYNITRLSAPMRKALNRERSNVGRTAYSDTVKRLLLKSKNKNVIESLVQELKELNMGEGYDEINYLDIQVHAMKTFNTQKPVVFISQIDAFMMSNDDKEKIVESGREIVIVPQAAFDKIENDVDEDGNPMGTFDLVRTEYINSFEYDWVSLQKLSPNRLSVWNMLPTIMDWLGDKKWRSKIKISKTINEFISGDSRGAFDILNDTIIIKDTVLDNEAEFIEVLIHEYIHATTGYSDNSREFENELGKIIGRMGVQLFTPRKHDDHTTNNTGSWIKKIKHGIVNK